MTHDPHMFDVAIRHQQSMFKIKILPVLQRALDCLFHEGRVLRMSLSENKFHGRFRPSVALEDSKSFLRPANLSAGDSPAETARVAQSLCFG
jgi:hypothetical protein